MSQEQKKKRGFWTRWLPAVCIVAAVCAGFCHSASAQNVILRQSIVLVAVGEESDLSGFLQEEYQDAVEFQLTSPALATEQIELSEQGVLRMKEEGTAILRVKEKGSERSELMTVHAVNPEQLTLEYGVTSTLRAAELLEGEKVTFHSDSDSVVMAENGMMEVQGFRAAKITVEQTDGSNLVVAEVSVTAPAFGKTAFVRAVGTSGYRIPIAHLSESAAAEAVRWETADSAIAVWKETGLAAQKKGTTKVLAVITAKNGETLTLTADLTVTDPKLSVSRIILAAGTTAKLSVTGTASASEIQWSTQEGAAYFRKSGVVYGDYAGSTNVKVIVDGKTLSCKVRVTDPYFSGFSFVLYKGMTKSISIKGKASLSKLKFVSGNKKVATVTAKGKVKGKKVGHATITATVDSRKIKIWVEVSSKRGYQASKKAIAISKTKTRYSQARRMSKGLYDCSSLVSRVYRQYRVYFGSKRGWSPVAANIAKWCKVHHKVVANKGVSYKKLLPGDLIFFSTKKNGRYRNITHVEMYTGEACDVSASSIYNKVVHYGYSNASSIVMIARPTK